MNDVTKVICPACCHEFTAIPEAVQAELARVREDVAKWKDAYEREATRYDDWDAECNKRCERVALRAAEIAYYEAELAGRKTVADVVAQAMREST